MPRFHCPVPMVTGHELGLPAGAARHVQVLRLQPGDSITLFNGGGQTGPAGPVGGEFEATVIRMGRNDVTVQIGIHSATEREAARAVHLAVGMPANERMDWLVEKATELGVASIQPLMTERSVLRLSNERAEKKVAHWQSIAIAACEQCGRNRVPVVHAVLGLAQWAKAWAGGPGARDNVRGGIGNSADNGRTAYLLSLRGDSQPLRFVMAQSGLDGSVGSGGSIDASGVYGAGELAKNAVTFLSGPEGGLSDGEEQVAINAGFAPVSLGTRVLRAETAALAALTLLA